MEVLDGALLDFGFPVGPITLLDEVGIDVRAKIPILEKRAGWREQFQAPNGAFDKLLEDDRKGRKNGKGFYPMARRPRATSSPAGGQKTVDASVTYDVLSVLASWPGRRSPSAACC